MFSPTRKCSPTMNILCAYFLSCCFYLFNRDTAVESRMKNVCAFLRSKQNWAWGQRAASSRISFYVILHNRSAFQNKAGFSFIFVQLNVLPGVIYTDSTRKKGRHVICLSVCSILTHVFLDPLIVSSRIVELLILTIRWMYNKTFTITCDVRTSIFDTQTRISSLTKLSAYPYSVHSYNLRFKSWLSPLFNLFPRSRR